MHKDGCTKYLYHGSFVPNIQQLYPISQNHDCSDEKVVYMTSNRAYALFYIWDPVLTGRQNKWVTCSIKDGVVCYYEQFPGQLNSFYNGSHGYVYSVKKDDTWIKASKPDTWLCTHTAQINDCDPIDNVYEEILRYEATGAVKIYYFEKLPQDEQEQNINMIVEYINNKQLLKNPNSEEAIFIATHHKDAWKRALKIQANS